MDIKQIYQGWKSLILEENKELAEKRLETCLNCDQNTTCGDIKITSTCKSCGCVLLAKTRCVECHCPKKLW